MNIQEIIDNTEIVWTKGKRISIKIKPDGRIIASAPKGTPVVLIESFIKQKETWIVNNLYRIRKQEEELSKLKPYTKQDIIALMEYAKKIIPARVEYYAKIVGVTYNRITIRNQVTRYGSCTRQGNLNFNCLLVDMPLEVMDSVIVHELCHRKQMNHSRQFYSEVYKAYPEYEKWNKWLKKNGGMYIKRMQYGLSGEKD